MNFDIKKEVSNRLNEKERDHLHKTNGVSEEHQDNDSRPAITITTEEHLVNDQAAAALSNDATLYQRGGLLVRIVRDKSPASKGIRRPLTPRIEPLPQALLRERLAAVARFTNIRETKEGAVESPGRPPAWCVSAVHARADWLGVRHLEAVVDYPVIRPDGTVLSTPGFDEPTGLLLEPVGDLPHIAARPTKADAIKAILSLLDVVSDFPFESEAHKSAWLAALLTPLARFAFHGPAPLFLVDANVRAAGKGLLLDCISRIITGERFTIATYTSDENELRKRITSLALAGDRLVLFDNLDGKFGNAVLDAALTGTSWEDRLLGVNRMARAPLFMTWYATGNNVIIAADTARRVCHVRLESPEERPEERRGFKHADLLQWVGDNRQRLLGAALTVLRAYFSAGSPDQNLTAWGSFEGWSHVVRASLVWAGQPDPAQTRMLLQERADVTAEGMGALMLAWEKMDPERKGLTAAEVVHRVFQRPDKNAPPEPDYFAALRDAIEALVGRADTRALGFKLRSFRRRIFQGRFFDRAGTDHQAAKWSVFPASAFRPGVKHPPHAPHTPPCQGEDDEDGEDILRQAETDSHDSHGDAWEG